MVKSDHCYMKTCVCGHSNEDGSRVTFVVIQLSLLYVVEINS